VCRSWAVLMNFDRKDARNSADGVTDFTVSPVPRTYVSVYRLPTVRNAQFVIQQFRNRSILRYPSVKSITNVKEQLVRTSVAVWYKKMCTVSGVVAECAQLNVHGMWLQINVDGMCYTVPTYK